MAYNKKAYTKKVEVKPEWATILKAAFSDGGGEMMKAYKAFHNYSIGNQMLAMFQLQDRKLDIAPLGTFKFWESKGRKVRKGQKGLHLCKPNSFKVSKTDKVTGDESEFMVTKFSYPAMWFAMSQTDGDAYEMPAALLKVWDKSKALETLKLSEIAFTLIDGNTQGYAVKATNEIAVNPLAQLPHKTLFHEIAHKLLHNDSDGISAAQKEVEAEGTALLLLMQLQLDGTNFAKGYMQKWGTDLKLTDEIAHKIVKCADKILKAGLVE
jgi:antirestriction protein ArdC